jgi:hypothetical protein
MHIVDFLLVLLKVYAAVIILLTGIVVALAVAKGFSALRKRLAAPTPAIENACSRSLTS